MTFTSFVFVGTTSRWILGYIGLAEFGESVATAVSVTLNMVIGLAIMGAYGAPLVVGR